MGQRTAIIVKLNNGCSDGHATTAVFYNSWGIGCAGFANVMGIALGALNILYHAERRHPANTADVTADIDPAMLEKVSFDNPRAVGEVLLECDNNNGGCYIEMEYNREKAENVIKYAFMLGSEEGGKYDRFCPAMEYAEKVGCPKDFLELFFETMEYMNAVDVCCE